MAKARDGSLAAVLSSAVVVEPDSSRVLQETTSNNGLPASLPLLCFLRGTRGQERWSDIRHNYSPMSSTRLSTAVSHTKHSPLLPLSALSVRPLRPCDEKNRILPLIQWQAGLGSFRAFFTILLTANATGTTRIGRRTTR